MAWFFTHTSTESRLMNCDVRNEGTMNTLSINFEPAIDHISSCLAESGTYAKGSAHEARHPMSTGRRHRIPLFQIPGQSLSVTLQLRTYSRHPGYLMCLQRQQLHRIRFRYQPVNWDAYQCQGGSKRHFFGKSRPVSPWQTYMTASKPTITASTKGTASVSESASRYRRVSPCLRDHDSHCIL